MGVNANEIHARAQQVYATVLELVSDDDLAKPTPCTEWDVAALIDHVNVGNGRVITTGGRVPVELPDDRVAAHAVSSAGAQAVFDAPDGLTRPFELPFGAEQPCPADRPIADRVAAFVGRPVS